VYEVRTVPELSLNATVLPSASVTNSSFVVAVVRVKYSSIPRPLSRFALALPPLCSCTGFNPSYRKAVDVPLIVFDRRRSAPS
jgi:hypothetical protein